jgi:hypothetical protein
MTDTDKRYELYGGEDQEGNPIEFNIKDSDCHRHTSRKRGGWGDFSQDASFAILYYRQRIAELERGMENLKKTAFGFGSFHLLSSEEEKRAKAFFEVHKRHGQPGRPVANFTSSITWCYTNAGCGSIIELRCRCGQSQDITDTDCW